MGLEFVVAWQNIVFLIPLCVGFILGFGSMAGHGSDHDTDHDIGHDVDHDFDHDVDVDVDHDLEADFDADIEAEADAGGQADDYVDGLAHFELAHHDHGHDVTALAKDVQPSFAVKALSLLGFGKVPLTVLLMMGNLIFGGIGISMNFMLAPVIGIPLVYGLISLAVASVCALLLTGGSAKLLSRLLPTSETVRITRHGFAGQAGVLLLTTDTSGGLAQIRDFQGNIHNIRCRTHAGELPRGGQVLVVEYDREKDTYVVAPDPTTSKSLTE